MIFVLILFRPWMHSACRSSKYKSTHYPLPARGTFTQRSFQDRLKRLAHLLRVALTTTDSKCVLFLHSFYVLSAATNPISLEKSKRSYGRARAFRIRHIHVPCWWCPMPILATNSKMPPQQHGGATNHNNVGQPPGLKRVPTLSGTPWALEQE